MMGLISFFRAQAGRVDRLGLIGDVSTIRRARARDRNQQFAELRRSSGIAGLRPRLKGISETIRVTSVLGRFLEHSRIFAFVNGGNREIYLSSADWMPRNFFRRVEAAFPLVDPGLARRLLRLFVELHRLGTAVVIATHDLQLMDQFGFARRLTIGNGKLAVFDGLPS